MERAVFTRAADLPWPCIRSSYTVICIQVGEAVVNLVFAHMYLFCLSTYW